MTWRASLGQKEEKARVRAALLRAALQLAARHGFSGLGLREVSREAGIAPTSFYRHFEDMEELGTVVISELAGQALRQLGERALAARRTEAVPELVDALHEVLAEDPDLMRFVLAERAGASAKFRRLLRDELGTLARTLHAAFSGEASAPKSAPPLAAESAVVLLFDAALAALDDAAGSTRSARERLIWAMRRLLSAKSGAGSA